MFILIYVIGNELGEVMFCAKDVVVALGDKNPTKAARIHVDEDDKTTALIQGPGSNYKTQAIFINESGLYSLILQSKLQWFSWDDGMKRTLIDSLGWQRR